MSNARISEKKKGKVARVPFGGIRLKMQLSVEDMAGFKKRKMVTHWFNDSPGRIERARAGGYEYVNPEHATSLGQSALHGDNTDLSKARVSIVVSRGDPIIRAYLMEIKEKFYRADQAQKELNNQVVDESIAVGGLLGSGIENAYKPS